jgi:hypothetical protein
MVIVSLSLIHQFYHKSGITPNKAVIVYITNKMFYAVLGAINKVYTFFFSLSNKYTN